MAAGYSLKDELFNPDTVRQLAQQFEDAGIFAADPFAADVLARMPPLELKERINLIAEVLATHLPASFPQAAKAIRKALPPPLDPLRTDDDFGHFIYAPLGVFVENHGIPDHIPLSLDLLEELTKRFSMEFSLRAFLNHDEAATLARVQDWAVSDNYHVRRLASEGTRPKLPWGQGVGLTHAQTLPILDQLHSDPTRYVVRSVANHLNDISKSDPDAVIAQLAAWRDQGAQNPAELAWLTKHALRTLIKAGHAGAMAHLGYRPDVAVDVQRFDLSATKIARGDTLTLDIAVATATSEPLIIDYVIDFMKSNGKSAPKVSKLKVTETQPGKPLHISKKHHFKDNATTFKLYPGPHRVHLQINGQIVASQSFDLS